MTHFKSMSYIIPIAGDCFTYVLSFDGQKGP